MTSDQDPIQTWRWAWVDAQAKRHVEWHQHRASYLETEEFETSLNAAWARSLDLFVLPKQMLTQGYGALVSDMDSTLIVHESLDELADALGAGEAVAAITAASMRGDLDFAQALDQRFALIKGVPKSAFVALGQTTALSHGAAEGIATLRAAGVHCTLATGGFDIIAQTVVKRLGMHDFVANALAFDGDDLFLGRLNGEVLDANAKLRTLTQAKARAGAKPCIAMGDGANDLAMIAAADVGIAYRAKPIVQQATKYHLNYADLSQLPFLLGLD